MVHSVKLGDLKTQVTFCSILRLYLALIAFASEYALICTIESAHIVYCCTLIHTICTFFILLYTVKNKPMHL